MDETKTIVITPEWESTAEWFAVALAQHSFERDARGPVISFIEQIRYLTLTDPEAVARIIERLSK